MINRRRSERLPVTMELSISDLFRQKSTGLHDLDSPIEVIDISSHGIGFISECVLPLNYYFNARVLLDEQTPAIFTVVKIIRSEVIDRTHYRYGCEFTNMPDDVADIIEKYSVKLAAV